MRHFALRQVALVLSEYLPAASLEHRRAANGSENQFPAIHNGLSKECVVRIDDTGYIDIDKVLEILGSLSALEFIWIKHSFSRTHSEKTAGMRVILRMEVDY
jgi:hypothetical protein